MDRLGFGSFTVWASNYPKELPGDISKVQDVKKVTVQNIIYAGYEAGGNYSDNEGQLMVYEDIYPYCFIDSNNKRYKGRQAEDGTVYVSPAIRQLYNIDIGDNITFGILRNNGKRTFKIAGFFEDAFMGSSMIDMKSFIISRNDFEEIQQDIKSTSGNDTLARTGAMFHILKQDNSLLNDSGFYQKLIEETSLLRYTEFTYKKESILNYMVLLQNILAGFMVFFSIMLFLICMVITCHSLEMVISQEKKDMALLKTTGLSSKVIQIVYLLLYGGGVIMGTVSGILPCGIVTSIFANGMVDSTGILIEINFPVKEVADLAVYRSLGITNIKLRMSFAMRFFAVPGAGAAAGSILSALFSSRITGRLSRLFGIGEFSTVTGITGNIIPLVLVPLTFFCFAWLYSKKLKDVNIINLIGQSEE